MKKILKLTILVICLISMQTHAKTYYFTNDNNVSFTKEEYDFFTAMFYDGYQDSLTQKEFESYKDVDMNKENVKVKYLDQIMPMSTIHETSAKQLKIASYLGSNYAKISVVLTWKGSPNVRSYDLMGAYFEGVSLKDTPITKVFYSDGSSTPSDLQLFNNGFGVSFKLPSSGNSIIISQSYETTLGGTVYASYQHAVSNTTLAKSKYYTINKTGYGRVFDFYNNMNNVYDGMGGVYISV